MARIPVEHKGGGGWWKWLLALLVLAAGIWILVEALDTDEPGIAEAPVEGVEPAPVLPPQDAPIMDLATLTNAPDAATYYGRDLQLNDLYVTRVVSDGTFFVCSAEAGAQGEPTTGMAGEHPCTTGEVLVVLDENASAGPTPPPGTAVEGAANVNEGQMVAITDGRVSPFQSTQADAWGLDQEEMGLAADDEFYIEANGVNILQQGVASAM